MKLQFDTKQLKVALQQRLSTLNMLLDDDALDKLLQYLGLLWKWSDTYNLTAIRDPGEMVDKHLADSLAIGQYLHGEFIADVGTGGGLPGIPLAIAYPEKQFTLIDCAGKKTRFLTQVIHELGLKNVKIQNVRVESFQSETGFDCIMSRAFASIHDFLTYTQHLCKKDGQFLAMKGVYPEEELAVIGKGFQLIAAYPLPLSDLGERHVILLGRA